MNILIRDYLAGLGESGELDVLVGDLLLTMGLECLSKPQRGVRQCGVDIAAVGNDPDDNDTRKLFLFTIKAGNITRSGWDGKSTDVRASLNEIKDTFIRNRIEKSHQDLPKKIVLCCGGKLKQDTGENWQGYVEQESKPGQLEYALWNGDKLARLVEEFFLDEYLFPLGNRSLMRKALALLDQNEQEPVFFYRLVDQVLFESNLLDDTSRNSHAKHLRALRLVNLCLRVVIKWALDLENSRPGLLCAEHTLLRTWDFLRQYQIMSHKPAQYVLDQVYEQYFTIASCYVERVEPSCLVEDGLVNWFSAGEVLEYPLRTFEVIGFLSTFGINTLPRQAPTLERHEKSAHKAADILVALIKNNRAAIAPRYDGHATDITLGLILLFMTNHADEALAWMEALSCRVTRAYALGEGFPISSDSYEDLLGMTINRHIPNQRLMYLSTLLPMIAEWYAIHDNQKGYAAFRDVVTSLCADVNLQLWYPDEKTESFLYRENACTGTGVMCTSISLPDDINVLRDRMRNQLKEHASVCPLSCESQGVPGLGLIASRHFRTPVIPAYWQRLVPEKHAAARAEDSSISDNE